MYDVVCDKRDFFDRVGIVAIKNDKDDKSKKFNVRSSHIDGWWFGLVVTRWPRST